MSDRKRPRSRLAQALFFMARLVSCRERASIGAQSGEKRAAAAAAAAARQQNTNSVLRSLSRCARALYFSCSVVESEDSLHQRSRRESVPKPLVGSKKRAILFPPAFGRRRRKRATKKNRYAARRQKQTRANARKFVIDFSLVLFLFCQRTIIIRTDEVVDDRGHLEELKKNRVRNKKKQV